MSSDTDTRQRAEMGESRVYGLLRRLGQPVRARLYVLSPCLLRTGHLNWRKRHTGSRGAGQYEHGHSHGGASGRFAACHWQG